MEIKTAMVKKWDRKFERIWNRNQKGKRNVIANMYGKVYRSRKRKETGTGMEMGTSNKNENPSGVGTGMEKVIGMGRGLGRRIGMGTSMRIKMRMQIHYSKLRQESVCQYTQLRSILTKPHHKLHHKENYFPPAEGEAGQLVLYIDKIMVISSNFFFSSNLHQ